MVRSVRIALLLSAAAVALSAAATGQEPAVVCTAQYLPVCAVDKNGVKATYSNACVARVAGARVVQEGPC